MAPEPARGAKDRLPTSQPQSRRSTSRIVPAIPYALSSKRNELRARQPGQLNSIHNNAPSIAREYEKHGVKENPSNATVAETAFSIPAKSADGHSKSISNIQPVEEIIESQEKPQELPVESPHRKFRRDVPVNDEEQVSPHLVMPIPPASIVHSQHSSVDSRSPIQQECNDTATTVELYDATSDNSIRGTHREPKDISPPSISTAGSLLQAQASIESSPAAILTFAAQSHGYKSGISNLPKPGYTTQYPVDVHTSDPSGHPRGYYPQQQQRQYHPQSARYQQPPLRRPDPPHNATHFFPHRNFFPPPNTSQASRIYELPDERLRPFTLVSPNHPNGYLAMQYGRVPADDIDATPSGPKIKWNGEASTEVAPMDPKTFTADQADCASLTRHIHNQFGQRDFADVVLQISHSSRLFQPINLPAHSLVLARSPKLRSLLAVQHHQSTQFQPFPRVMHATVSDRFLNQGFSLLKALICLYGEAPLQALPVPSNIDRQNERTNTSIRVEHTRVALSFAAAGHFLEMNEIIDHGLSVVSQLMDWTTLEICFAFAVNHEMSRTLDQSESIVESKTVPIGESSAAAPTYGSHSDRILRSCIEHLVQSLPVDFQLHSSCSQSCELPRLPSVAEPNVSRASSRLSQIRFGEMDMEEPSVEERAAVTYSSLLISLPYPVLKPILENATLRERLGVGKVMEIGRATVAERERRRKRARSFRDGGTFSGVAMEEAAWKAVSWAEAIVWTNQTTKDSIRMERLREGVNEMATSPRLPNESKAGTS